MQEFLRTLTARHESDYTGYYGGHRPQREFPKAIHPVIRTHPVTGRDALFVNAGFTKRINELSKRESTVLLRFLFDHIQNPRFQCRFHLGTKLDCDVGQSMCATYGDLGLLSRNPFGDTCHSQGDKPHLKTE